MIKVVIIGASGHYPYAIWGVKANTNAQILGMAPASEEETQRVKEKLDLDLAKGIPFYSDYKDMLEKVKPDIVAINSYFYLNGPLTIECLKRGIHCYTEKPLTFYREELSIIKELLVEKKLKLSTMLEYRYHPAFYTAFKAIEAGAIGDPIHLTAQKSYKSGLKPEWQHRRDQFGGLISWVGSHALDWILWMTDNGVASAKALDTTIGNNGNGEM